MRVLVVGGGGREHALVSRLIGDRAVTDVVCAPGNPGIAALAKTVAADVNQPRTLADIAERERVDFTVVGPELPLSLGIADLFGKRGLPVFGPTQAAARLESSKAFSKSFMARHKVPTARFRTCESRDEAHLAITQGEFGWPVVVKADGLAAGKGVVIAGTSAEAHDAVSAAMTDRRFGPAGARVVLEECLEGPEVSFFVVADGERAVPIGTAQDHKRIFDGDRGPNTGGMGAFAPSPLVDGSLSARVMREIVEPVISGMSGEGCPFRGFLYVGLMLTPDGPKVIEFNVRLGDPEAQVILPLIDEPLLPLLQQAAEGTLTPRECRWSPGALVGVVLASRGYPEAAETGQTITGVAEAERVPNVTVYHAGTADRSGTLVTAGGRVLTVVGRGHDFDAAALVAYEGVGHIKFDGMQFRHDIGATVRREV
jgi:phosphoribosylamine--glycine ligase